MVYVGVQPGQYRYTYETVGLRVFDPAGAGSSTVLTTNPTDSDPQVSPDGRLVVFSRTVRTAPGESVSGLFVIGVDGSGLRQLTEGTLDGAGDEDPAFFPSGRSVAFVR